MSNAIPPSPSEYDPEMAKIDPELVADIAEKMGRTPEELMTLFRPPNEYDVLDVADMAERLDMNERTVYRLIRSGELPAKKVGGQWRITVRAFANWLDDLETTDD